MLTQQLTTSSQQNLPPAHVSRRQALFTLASLLASNVTAQAFVPHDSPAVEAFDKLGENLGSFTFKELGFDSKYQLSRWAQDKLSDFSNGELKIEGCKSISEAGEFLLAGMKNVAEGFSALGRLHYRRELNEISDNVWFGELTDSANNLRATYHRFKYSNHLMKVDLDELKHVAEPMLTSIAKHEHGDEVGMWVTAGAITTGLLALGIRELRNLPPIRTAKERAESTPGLF